MQQNVILLIIKIKIVVEVIEIDIMIVDFILKVFFLLECSFVIFVLFVLQVECVFVIFDDFFIFGVEVFINGVEVGVEVVFVIMIKISKFRYILYGMQLIL